MHPVEVQSYRTRWTALMLSDDDIRVKQVHCHSFVLVHRGFQSTLQRIEVVIRHQDLMLDQVVHRIQVQSPRTLRRHLVRGCSWLA